MTATNEIALKKKQGVTPTVAMSRPPTAGPTIREVFIAIELSAIALAMRSRPTMLLIRLCRAGPSNTFTMPSETTTAVSAPSDTCPVSDSTANTSDSRAKHVWVMIIIPRLSDRSVTRPPHGPSSNSGTNRAAVIAPSTTPLWLSCRTTQLIAMFCIQLPATDVLWPKK
jgi:hypothetical protein